MPQTLDEQYQQCLNTLYQKLPMFTRVGAAAYKPDLGNIQTLCELLQHPEQTFKTIHVAGTNGKGSVSHMLAAVLQSAGYKTGLYTSPHIHDFRERIKINGLEIPKENVLNFWHQYERLFEPVQASFFEITVAMAFDYFAKEQVDIAVIEVGLGGLYDSTNIISPEVSVITNISKDHMDLLGDTVDAIARQKAGIIKPQIPVVIGETQSETEKIFLATAISKQASIVFADQQFEVINPKWEQGIWKGSLVHLSQAQIQPIEVGLSGAYQWKNVKTVMATLDVLKRKGWKLSDLAIRAGIRDVKKLTGLRGRFDIIHVNPLVVLDVSHNEAGIQELMAQLNQLSLDQLHIVTGVVKDKDVQNILRLYPKDANYYFTQASIPRALPHDQLQAQAGMQQLHGESYDNIETACSQALRQCAANDVLLVTGSFFILDDAYRFFEQELSR